MKSGFISKTSPVVDMLEILTGTWDDYTEGEFRVTHTPFFTVMTATLDAGKHPLPFTVSVPVAATLAKADGSISAVIIRPGETAIDLPAPGIFNLQVFGGQATLKRT